MLYLLFRRYDKCGSNKISFESFSKLFISELQYEDNSKFDSPNKPDSVKRVRNEHTEGHLKTSVHKYLNANLLAELKLEQLVLFSVNLF